MDPLATRDVQSSSRMVETLTERSVCFPCIVLPPLFLSLPTSLLYEVDSACLYFVHYHRHLGRSQFRLRHQSLRKSHQDGERRPQYAPRKTFCTLPQSLQSNQDPSFTPMKSNSAPQKQSSGTSAARLSRQSPCLNGSSTSSMHAHDGSAR